MKEYAIYRGDTFVDLGTAKELAERLGVKENTIYCYASKSKKYRYGEDRMIAVEMDGDEEEEGK